MMNLKASRTPSKINDISRVLAGVDEDFDVPDPCVLDDIIYDLHMT